MSRRRRLRWVEHAPRWIPAVLTVEAVPGGRVVTVKGFRCVHRLENGLGVCGSHIMYLWQSVGRHACTVDRHQNRRRLMHQAYGRRRLARIRRRRS